MNFFFEELSHAVEWAQNLPLSPDAEPVISRQTIQWRGLNFTGRYRAVIFAADDNFKDFFLTHSLVQEPDGNFHEPKFNMAGDGVGVFGSAIVDTVYFDVANSLIFQ